jgi:hypothetical protein
MNWLEVPAGKYSLRSSKSVSRCQIEMDCKFVLLLPHLPFASAGQRSLICSGLY